MGGGFLLLLWCAPTRVVIFVDCCVLAGGSVLCGGVSTLRAGGTFQMYCEIGRLSWLTSGL